MQKSKGKKQNCETPEASQSWRLKVLRRCISICVYTYGVYQESGFLSEGFESRAFWAVLYPTGWVRNIAEHIAYSGRWVDGERDWLRINDDWLFRWKRGECGNRFSDLVQLLRFHSGQVRSPQVAQDEFSIQLSGGLQRGGFWTIGDRSGLINRTNEKRGSSRK